MRNILCVFILLFACSASAADYYVTSSGAGDNSGDSWANAMAESDFETFIEGTPAAGDFIYIAGGTYTLDSTYSVGADGTQASPITVIGVDSGTTNEPPTTSDWATGDDRPLLAASSYSMDIGDDYWHFYNLRVTSTANPAFRVGYGGMVRNCKITKTGSGWALETNGSKTAFINNEVSNATGDAAIAVTNGDTCWMIGNYAHDSATCFYAGRDNTILVNNIADTCGSYGMRIIGYRAMLYGNTLYGANDADAVGIDSSTGGYAVIMNNIIQDWFVGAQWTTEQGTNFFDYNNWYSNGTDVSNATKGANAQAADAGFTDAANGDFSIGTNLQADGFPGAFPGGLSTGYVDIGAVQRQEPAGDGGGAVGYFSMD